VDNISNSYTFGAYQNVICSISKFIHKLQFEFTGLTATPKHGDRKLAGGVDLQINMEPKTLEAEAVFFTFP